MRWGRCKLAGAMPAVHALEHVPGAGRGSSKARAGQPGRAEYQRIQPITDWQRGLHAACCMPQGRCLAREAQLA